MSGKYDPDGPTHDSPKYNPAKPILPEIPHVLTEEEWLQSEPYLIQRNKSIETNKRYLASLKKK